MEKSVHIMCLLGLPLTHYSTLHTHALLFQNENITIPIQGIIDPIIPVHAIQPNEHACAHYLVV